jgi:hypothetical protein
MRDDLGLFTGADTLRYTLETGRRFDVSAPATRQEYAFIIESMVNILRRLGVDLERTDVSAPLTALEQGLGIMKPRAPIGNRDERLQGIGGTSAEFRNNIGEGIQRPIDAFADSQEIRGSARRAMEFALNWGILNPKTFAEKEIFLTGAIRDENGAVVNLTEEEFAELNEAARLRAERLALGGAIHDNITLIPSERGLFTAPNDLVTIDDLLMLEAAFRTIPVDNRR